MPSPIKEKNGIIIFWSNKPKPNQKGIGVECFSQWYNSPFIDDSTGTQYFCMEQYMMSQKAILFNDLETNTEVMESTSPKEIQKLGRKVKNFDQTVWNNHKFNIVKNGNYLKFSQNSELSKILLNTYPHTLAEGSPYDLVWGIGYREGNENAYIQENWKGENLLGKALMNVRQDLIKDLIKEINK